jgi:hypothetical protein
MPKALKYVSLPDLYYLMEGLTFGVPACAEVLDSALNDFNKATRIPDQILSWNQKPLNRKRPLAFVGRGRIAIDIMERLGADGRPFHAAAVIESKDEKETSPVVFFSMHSISLDIPMRTEVPLRAVIKGGARLRGTYCVYLHVLLADDGQEFVYYGITKRGWALRFAEHTATAVRDESRRLFPRKLHELIAARVAQLQGEETPGPRLSGIITAICAIGLDEESAMDTEEYLVEKYSLSSKHQRGLNMIPGGREGIRALGRLSLGGTASLVETEDREEVLNQYLKEHPLLGRPNPGIAEKWNDPAYAEAVICARENRLTADQVREIRYLAALGNTEAQIRNHVGALDNAQVSRVLAGRTYARIR